MVSPYSLLGNILEPSSDVEQATRHGHQSKQEAHRQTEIITAVHRYLYHQPFHGVPSLTRVEFSDQLGKKVQVKI